VKSKLYGPPDCSALLAAASASCEMLTCELDEYVDTGKVAEGVAVRSFVVAELFRNNWLAWLDETFPVCMSIPLPIGTMNSRIFYSRLLVSWRNYSTDVPANRNLNLPFIAVSAGGAEQLVQPFIKPQTSKDGGYDQHLPADLSKALQLGLLVFP
jgi:hypothetical protein